MELMQRKDVPVELTWDLTAIYDDEAKWKSDVEKVRRLSEEIEQTYKGKLTTAEAVHGCLDKFREWEELMILTVQYSSLAASVDYGDAALQERNDALSRLDAQMASRLSFIDSEIIAQDESLLRQAIAQGGPNQPYLEDLLRQKPYQLQPETERVLAALRPAINAPYDIYNMAKLADMKFPSRRTAGSTPWAIPSTRTSTSTTPVPKSAGKHTKRSTGSSGSTRTSPPPPIRPTCRERRSSRTSGATSPCSTICSSGRRWTGACTTARSTSSWRSWPPICGSTPSSCKRSTVLTK